MTISIIAALGRNRVIGKRGALPWYLPADLKHFKALTMGHPILMGRKTFESIGRALPGRTNIILTRDDGYKAQDCLIAHSIEEALQLARDGDEVFVIGGAELYREILPRADRFYLTLIDADFEGDVFFPEFDKNYWIEMSRENHVADNKNPYDYSFVVLQKRGS